MAQRISDLYLPPRDLPGGLRDVSHRISAGSINSAKVKNLIFPIIIPGNIPQNGVDAGSGIGNEDASIHRNVEERGDGFAGLVEELGVSVEDESVWTSFGLLAEVVGEGGDCGGGCSEGT